MAGAFEKNMKRKSRDKRIARGEVAKSQAAAAEYKDVMQEQEQRQKENLVSGLGALITTTPEETVEEIEAKKKRQGLGALLVGSGFRLG